MKLQLLASVVVVLLSAVPGVFSEVRYDCLLSYSISIHFPSLTNLMRLNNVVSLICIILRNLPSPSRNPSRALLESSLLWLTRLPISSETNLMLRSKDKWSQESLGSAVAALAAAAPAAVAPAAAVAALGPVVAAPGTTVVVVGACAEFACAAVTVARAALSGATSVTAAVTAAATAAYAATWASRPSPWAQLRMHSKPLPRIARFSLRRRNVRWTWLWKTMRPSSKIMMTKILRTKMKTKILMKMKIFSTAGRGLHAAKQNVSMVHGYAEEDVANFTEKQLHCGL